jgi:hypothetical protein
MQPLSFSDCEPLALNVDIHQLNLIMEILGTPHEEFMQKISSESVSNIASVYTHWYGYLVFVVHDTVCLVAG